VTIGATLFFVILLASTTLAIRSVTRHRKWPLVGIAMTGLVAVVALHDAALVAGTGHAGTDEHALAGAPPPWSAADIHAWLAQDTLNPGDGRWQLIRSAVARASDQVAPRPDLQTLQWDHRQLCAGNELPGIPAIGIADARSNMLEDLVARPCRAPGFQVFQQR